MPRSRRLGILAGLLGLSLLLAARTGADPAHASWGNELVIGLKSGAAAGKAGLIREAGAFGGKLKAPPLGRACRFVFPSGAAARWAADRLEDAPNVDYVEPLLTVKAAAVPNDPFYPTDGQWGLRRIEAETAWDSVRGAGVALAVLDTGLDLGHPELAPKLVLNAADPPDGRDNDRNGFTDDYRGWNFVAGSPDPQDDAGHGTHVAGIAAAQGNNAGGVAGVAWDARILAIKVLDENGDGNTFDVAAGIRYAVSRGARVVNLSFGGPGFSNVLAEAVSFARRRNVLVVAAAGNRIPGVVFPYVAYPAAYTGVIGVGAVDPNGEVQSWSNRGLFVDAVAPGVGILSSSWRKVTGSTYETRTGTSMASAFVAGEAVLLWSENPRASLEAVENTILTSARDLGARGRDDLSGRGEINLANAFLAQGLRPVPATFSPDSDGVEDATVIGYRLLAPAKVSLAVVRGGENVRQLLNLADRPAGEQSIVWDGRSAAGLGLSNGLYRLALTASGPGGTGYRQVDVGLASPLPKVASVWSEPNPFAPNADGHNDESELHYSLDRPGFVTIKVFSAKGALRTVRNDAYRPAGAHFDLWNGRDAGGLGVAPGTYRYEITARNSHGGTTARGTVRVGPEPLPAAEALTDIEGVLAQGLVGSQRPPVSFCYSLDGKALVSVIVFQGNRQVRAIIAGKFRSEGSHCEGWSGTDDSGRVVPAGSYGYTIYAANSRGTRTYRGSVTLEQGGG